MKKNNDEGFTLIELLIVIVILGILATVVVFSVRGITDQGQDNACKADAKTLEVAIEAYYAKYGSDADPTMAYSANRRIVHLVPDEPGVLAMARFLSGGQRWNMFGTFTWQPGLSFLIAPINWITDDPVIRYRAALLVVAAIAGCSAVVLAAITRRLTGLERTPSAAIAFVICVSPSSLSATSHVWAESLVSLTFLGALWFVLHIVQGAGSQPRAALAAVTCAAAGYASHNRLLPLLGVVAVLVAARAARCRDWRTMGLVIAAAVAQFAAIRLVTDWIVSNVWDDTLDTNSASSTVERLANPLQVGDALVGQLWYQQVATLGIAVVGLVVLLGAAVRRSSSAAQARAVLALFLPMVAVSATFVAGRDRGDFRFYGRYNDAVIWPVLAIGIGWLIAAPGVRSVVSARVVVGLSLASTLVSGLFVEIRHGADILEEGVSRVMVPGLIAYSYEAFEIRILVITAAATVGFLALLLVASWPGRYSGALVALVGLGLLLVGGIRARDGLDVLLNAGMAVESVTDTEQYLRPDEPLGVRPAGEGPDEIGVSRRRIHFIQFFLVDRTLYDVEGPSPNDDIRFIFASSADAEMIAVGATTVWTDPIVDVALWREPFDWGGG
jgi:prepilin-type N-terminal cleavage/methylation domain-containing protein